MEVERQAVAWSSIAEDGGTRLNALTGKHFTRKDASARVPIGEWGCWCLSHSDRHRGATEAVQRITQAYVNIFLVT